MLQSEDLLPPLPTAAAHHPQHMVSFLAPITPTSSVTDLRPAQSSDCGATLRVNALITERLASEEQTNYDFREALNRMRTMREGLQARLRLIPDGVSARAQSGNLTDVPTPTAPSKNVMLEAQTQKQAARPHAPNQVTQMGRASTVHSMAFPLPTSFQVRKPPSHHRTPSLPTVEPTQPTLRFELDTLNHSPNDFSQSPDPATTVPRFPGADCLEGMPKVTRQSAGKARPTTTQERNAPVCLFTSTLFRGTA
jgi:hypothetical protein